MTLKTHTFNYSRLSDTRYTQLTASVQGNPLFTLPTFRMSRAAILCRNYCSNGVVYNAVLKRLALTGVKLIRYLGTGELECDNLRVRVAQGSRGAATSEDIL